MVTFQEAHLLVLQKVPAGTLILGHREGGPTAFSKNFKTPFFKRYAKNL